MKKYKKKSFSNIINYLSLPKVLGINLNDPSIMKALGVNLKVPMK